MENLEKLANIVVIKNGESRETGEHSGNQEWTI